MSQPIIEQIAVAIADLVDGITGLTALRPKRVFFLDDVTGDGTVVVTQDQPEKGESTLYTQDWLQPFSLTALLTDSDTATDSIDTRLNAIRSDLEKALLADPTLGGLAIDTVVEPPTYFNAEDLTGVEVKITVHYRTQYDDPYAQA